MAKMYRTAPFKGPLMRVSYAYNLFTLREMNGDSGTRRIYGCTLIIEKADPSLSILQKAIAEVVNGQWREKGADKFKSGLIKNPILAGDGKEARSKETGDVLAGLGSDKVFIRVQANEDRAPLIFAPDAVTRLVDPDGLPSGSWGYPVLNAWAWHNPKNGDGVSFGIEMFQLARKAEGDEVLGGGGRPDPSKFFESVKTADDGGQKPGSAAAMFD